MLWKNIKKKEGLAVKSTAYLILSSTFNGIDKITGSFMAKADRQKSSKIKVDLTMPQRTPKRRSPNPYNTRLKWTVRPKTC